MNSLSMWKFLIFVQVHRCKCKLIDVDRNVWIIITICNIVPYVRTDLSESRYMYRASCISLIYFFFILLKIKLHFIYYNKCIDFNVITWIYIHELSIYHTCIYIKHVYVLIGCFSDRHDIIIDTNMCALSGTIPGACVAQVTYATIYPMPNYSII